jgi:hypothetical protein
MFHFQSLLLHIFQSNPKMSPPSMFRSQSPMQRDASFPEPSFFTCLTKSPVKKSPLQGPPTGPPWREVPVIRAFFYISFKAPVKEPPPPKFPSQSPLQRDAPFPEHSFTCLSKSPVKESFLQVHPAGPIWRETPVPEPSFTYLSET